VNKIIRGYMYKKKIVDARLDMILLVIACN